MQTKKCSPEDKVCLKNRQTFSRPGRGRPKALRIGAILQTNFVCKCRQTLPANADKRCAFCRQGSSKNADKFCRRIFSRPIPPKCRQTSSKMQTRALHFSRKCRQIMQTKFVYIILGTSAFWFVYRRSKVCLQTS